MASLGSWTQNQYSHESPTPVLVVVYLGYLLYLTSLSVKFSWIILNFLVSYKIKLKLYIWNYSGKNAHRVSSSQGGCTYPMKMFISPHHFHNFSLTLGTSGGANKKCQGYHSKVFLPYTHTVFCVNSYKKFFYGTLIQKIIFLRTISNIRSFIIISCKLLTTFGPF